MAKILERVVASNYLYPPERSYKNSFLLADDGFIYVVSKIERSFSVCSYQRLREGLSLQELVNWEQYLHTDCWIKTKSGKEKIFRSEQKLIHAIETDQICWSPSDCWGEGRRKAQYEARIASDYLPSMLRWALKKAKEIGESESWILKKGSVASLEQPWNNKNCKVLPFIGRESVIQMLPQGKDLCADDSPTPFDDKPSKNINTKRKVLPNTIYKITKSVGGRIFWEGGFRTGECPGMICSSGMPRWFCDLRSEGKIRVNSMSYSVHYLRSDGKFFHATGCSLYPETLLNAFSDDRHKIEDFLEGVYARGGTPSHSSGFEIWECCEYAPDSDCDDLSSFWKVAATVRRTGRFFYASKKKVLKDILEGPEDSVPWVYAPKFDQFTEEYEMRYKNRIEVLAKEEEERKKRGARRVSFNVEDLVAIQEVNHSQILQVSPSASPREIKTAYWELAKQFHPDLNPGNKDAEEKFKQLSISYQELMKGY